MAAQFVHWTSTLALSAWPFFKTSTIFVPPSSHHSAQLLLRMTAIRSARQAHVERELADVFAKIVVGVVAALLEWERPARHLHRRACAWPDALDLFGWVKANVKYQIPLDHFASVGGAFCSRLPRSNRAARRQSPIVNSARS
jgi:hypothetical protein